MCIATFTTTIKEHDLFLPWEAGSMRSFSSTVEKNGQHNILDVDKSTFANMEDGRCGFGAQL